MSVTVFVTLLFAAVGHVMTYVNDPCYLERDVQSNQNADLLSVNIASYSDTLGEVKTSVVYFVENKCELDIYTNTHVIILDGVFFDDIKMECKLDGSDFKTPLPEVTILAINNFWVAPPSHTLPEYFNDFIVSISFMQIVAEGPVHGSCQPYFAILGPPYSPIPGNLTFAVEVKGCPAQKYGLYCNKTCECSDGVKCHNFNGECLCPTGLNGTICNVSYPILEVTSQYEYPTWGSKVEINCTVHGLQNAVIEWTKDGIHLPTISSESYVQYKPRPIQSTLLLHNVTDQNNGVYTCTANNTNDVSIQKTVKITVINVPNPFIEVTSNQTVKRGGTVTLTCRVKPAAGAIVWVKGREIPSIRSTLNNSDNIQIIDNITMGLSQLIITNVTLQDESFYRCYVGHIIEDTIDFSESQVVVYVDPLEPYPRLTGYNNRDDEKVVIDLKCETNLSKPVVELSWFLDSSFVEPFDTLTVLGDSLFNVTAYFSATIDDNNKEVMCVARSPSFGERNSSIILNITYAPIVNVYPQSIKIEAGDDVLVTCNASANPAPISYNWTVKLADDSQFLYTNERLELDDVTTDFDKVVVTCWVTNSLGSSSATVVSFVVVGPGPRLEIIIPTVASGVVLLVIILYLITYKHRHTLQAYQADIYLRIFKPKRDQGKEYDCYISYKEDGEDEHFVVRSFTPWLEQKGYTVCVDYKCFLPGDVIEDNITKFMSKSRTIIVILSPSFFRCNWCNYELKTAYTNLIEGHSTILPIIYEDIQDDAKTNFVIKTLFNGVTYLTWPRGDVDEGAERKFWRAVDSSLGLLKNGRNIQNQNEIGENINMVII